MQVTAAQPTDRATYNELLLELDDDELLLELLDELDDDDELLLDELLLELLDELDDDKLLLLDLQMEHAVCSGILCRWCCLAVSCMHACMHKSIYVCICAGVYCMPSGMLCMIAGMCVYMNACPCMFLCTVF